MTEKLPDLEKFWNKDVPSCMSCSWTPAFYEVELSREPSEDSSTHECYHATCVSKDADEPSEHRGHYLYVPKGKTVIP